MAIIGHGSTLTILGPTGTTTVNQALACLSIDFGSNKVDTPEVTDMLTAGTTKQFIAGLENSGDVSVKYNVKPGDAGQAALAASKGIIYDFKVTYPGNVRTRAFTGIVNSIDESIPNDKAATKSAKIQINGALVDTDSTGTLVAVPDVVGKTLATATTALTTATLVLGLQTTAAGSGLTAGQVITTNPVFGTMVAPGTAVNLVLES
jgi:hypothetical protein